MKMTKDSELSDMLPQGHTTVARASKMGTWPDQGAIILGWTLGELEH